MRNLSSITDIDYLYIDTRINQLFEFLARIEIWVQMFVIGSIVVLITYLFYRFIIKFI